jgi:hypothetical protein
MAVNVEGWVVPTKIAPDWRNPSTALIGSMTRFGAKPARFGATEATAGDVASGA